PTLLSFEQALIKAERPFDPTIAKDPVSYYDIASYVSDANVKVLVAEVDGQIVASGYALRKEARHYLDHKWYGYLGFMYTKREYRGKGINQKVTQGLVAWCKEMGLNEVRLTVYDENQSAVNAYLKSGFEKHIMEMRLKTTH
ncbi:MAG: GNAT family N-acetyltransferase, partial [Bacteroidota bacterium]